MAPWPLTTDGVYQSFRQALVQGRIGVGEKVPEGWDGRAAARIVRALKLA